MGPGMSRISSGSGRQARLCSPRRHLRRRLQHVRDVAFRVRKQSRFAGGSRCLLSAGPRSGSRGPAYKRRSGVRERLAEGGVDLLARHPVTGLANRRSGSQRPVDLQVEQGGPLWTVASVGGDLRLALADRLMTGFGNKLPGDVADLDMMTWRTST